MDTQKFIESVQSDLRADLASGRAKLELAENLQGSVLWARLCKVPREDKWEYFEPRPRMSDEDENRMLDGRERAADMNSAR